MFSKNLQPDGGRENTTEEALRKARTELEFAESAEDLHSLSRGKNAPSFLGYDSVEARRDKF